MNYYCKIPPLFLFCCIAVHIAAAQPTHATFTDKSRETYLQNALQLRQEGSYANAIALLDTILFYRKNEPTILLLKGDLQLQSNLYANASKTYQLLLPLNFEATVTKINLSYALFMSHHPANALSYAHAAWQGDKQNVNAIINYFNALLWNRETQQAALFLAEQEAILTQTQATVLKARLATTSGNYRKGLRLYDSLLLLDSNKYFVQEFAEVLIGKNDFKTAEKILERYRNAFSTVEYAAISNNTKSRLQQNAGSEFLFFKDVGKNLRTETNLWWQQGADKKYRFKIGAGRAEYKTASAEKTKAIFSHLTISERWNLAWTGQSDLHLQRVDATNEEEFTAVTAKQVVQFQPKDTRMFGASLQSEILNFTASLLGKNIRHNSINFLTHWLLPGKNGFYSQASFGFITDKNQKGELFGSAYHLFRTEPTIKSGLNITTVHYKDNSVKNYFSPERFNSKEIFAEYSSANNGFSKWFLQFQAAAGIQKIEDQKSQSAFRLQVETGFRAKHFETIFKYQKSNVAAVSGSGYGFNWYTLRTLWKW